MKNKATHDSRNAFGGSTPLYCAADNGHDSIVELLLKTNSVNVNTEFSDRYETWSSPLLSAAMGGHAAVIRLLVGAGADVTFCNEKSQTALELAAENGHQDVVELLQAHPQHLQSLE